MASLARFVALLSVSFFAASANAAMIFDIKLCNATGSLVELVDGHGRTWRQIEPGQTKAFSYYGGVSLRCGGRRLSYARVIPPSDYISAGLFSVSFKAQLAPDLRIYLLPPSASQPTSHLPSQPKGFPLHAATTMSNQSRGCVKTPRAKNLTHENDL